MRIQCYLFTNTLSDALWFREGKVDRNALETKQSTRR